jgi:hypothetical protein
MTMKVSASGSGQGVALHRLAVLSVLPAHLASGHQVKRSDNTAIGRPLPTTRRVSEARIYLKTVSQIDPLAAHHRRCLGLPLAITLSPIRTVI